MRVPRRLLSWSVSLLAACAAPEAAPPTPGDDAPALVLLDSAIHLGAPAREPMVVHHPGGALFVSGYGGPGRGYRGSQPLVPRLWRSDDGGRSWRSVDVGDVEDGAVGNSDADMAVGPDGTLYFVNLRFDPGPRQGVSVAMGVSRDVGATWRWSFLDRSPFDDRPWVGVTPDGTAHAVWADTGGVYHAPSADGGVTWAEPARVHPAGGSSHLAVGPSGELAIRIGPTVAGAPWPEDWQPDLVSVSTDGGRSWASHPAPAQLPWRGEGAVYRWVEPLAFDREGALHALWSEGGIMRLGRSTDGGATWRRWTVAESAESLFFPYLVSGDGGLAATWMSRGHEHGLRGHLALIGPGAGRPGIVIAEPFRLEVGPDAGGEYLASTFLPDGSIAVVAPVQNIDAGRVGFTFRRYGVRR